MTLDLNTTIIAAKLSEWIYLATLKAPLIVLTFLSKGSTQAALLTDGYRYFLVFRGTELNKPEDLHTDLNIISEYLNPTTFVHRGFYQAYLSIQEEVNQAVAKLPANAPLYVCGHSLGGALAVIASTALHRPVEACITFGCPKVGNKAFYALMRAPYCRIVNDNDLVPSIPSGILLIIRTKIIKRHWLDSWYTQAGSLYWFRDSGMTQKYTMFHRHSFRDHNIKEYLQRLYDYRVKIHAVDVSKDR